MSQTVKTLILIVFLIASAVLIIKSGILDNITGKSSSNNDYKAVAESFIRKNVFISHKIGKVVSIVHYGSGGEAGPESYNVYSLTGTERTAVCYVTLEKNDKGGWKVIESSLSLDGGTLKVPVKQPSESGSLLKFKFK